MTLTTIALTLGIIAAITVIVAMCCIIIGAASVPLSQFDSPYRNFVNGGVVLDDEQIADTFRTAHSHFGQCSGDSQSERLRCGREVEVIHHHAVPNSTRMDV